MQGSQDDVDPWDPEVEIGAPASEKKPSHSGMLLPQGEFAEILANLPFGPQRSSFSLHQSRRQINLQRVCRRQNILNGRPFIKWRCPQAKSPGSTSEVRGKLEHPHGWISLVSLEASLKLRCCGKNYPSKVGGRWWDHFGFNRQDGYRWAKRQAPFGTAEWRTIDSLCLVGSVRPYVDPA